MKNKATKKLFFFLFLLTNFFLLLFLFVNLISWKRYEQNNNYIVAKIISNIIEENPSYEEKIIELLNTEDIKNNAFFLSYGIDLKDASLSLSNQKLKRKTFFLSIFILLFYLFFLLLFVYLYTKKENKKIKKITSYMKELNNKNYVLDIETNSEDDLSILKNEIYKTSVMLNEQSMLLKKDKDTLKDSLSDISHQIKTPLTSITLMLERLEDVNLTKEERKEILSDVHRKMSHINFLIYSLLKLSKFDANAITFDDKWNTLEDIFMEVEDNLSVLCDLKDIKLHIKGNKKDCIYCDFKWQVEALTNIIKNCLEYSKDHSKIDISYTSNDLFTKIIIQDYGVGMEKEECNHIFERFYKGKQAKEGSVGIGLALAKAIIEKDKGYITVSSVIGKGTMFTIKYLK